MFQPSNGDRSNAPNYLVILTDGNSDNATSTWHEAMRARARGINIITVSITARFIDSAWWKHFVFISPSSGVLCVNYYM